MLLRPLPMAAPWAAHRLAGDVLPDQPQRSWLQRYNEPLRLLCGYAVAFGRPTDVRQGGHRITFAPGAFDGLARRWPPDRPAVQIWIDHHDRSRIASEASGGLLLDIDAFGVWCEILAEGWEHARGVVDRIEGGHLGGLSVSFHGSYREGTYRGRPLRIIEVVDTLREVSLTPWPAIPETSVRSFPELAVGPADLRQERDRLQADEAAARAEGPAALAHHRWLKAYSRHLLLNQMAPPADAETFATLARLFQWETESKWIPL